MRTILLLLAAVAIGVVPMLVRLGTPGPQTNMEGLALLGAQETWQRQHSGEAGAWLTPTQNGQIRVRKPPGFVWSCMLAWTGLDPEFAGSRDLIWRARLMSVGLVALMIVSTFWIGRTLGGKDMRGLGLLAALIVGTLPLVHEQGRLATYDMHVAAWSVFAAASALWAVQPLADEWVRRRLIVGVVIAMIALATAWMSKGPIALAGFGAPLIAAVLVAPAAWRRGVLTILICALGACLLVLPWYLWLWKNHPAAVETLRHEFGASLTNAHGAHFYPVTLLKLSMPWTILLIAGLLRPFVIDPQRRARAMMPWLWFMILLVALSIPSGKAARYILPIAPAIALLTAGVLSDMIRFAAAGIRDRGAATAAWIHWTVLGVISFGLGPVMAGQNWLIDRPPGVLSSQFVSPISWTVASLLTTGLFLAAGLGAWWHQRGRPARGAAMVGVWLAIAAGVFWYADAGMQRKIDLIEDNALRVRAIVRDQPLGYFWRSSEDQPDWDFIFFMQRIIPPIPTRRLDEFGSAASANYVMADATAACDNVLREAGFAIVEGFTDSPPRARRLWVRHREVK